MKVWLLLLTITLTCAREKPSKLGYSRLNLSPSIVLEWRINYDAMEAEMRVKARLGPRDWLGVGFSDYGAVQGADLCIVFRDWRGQVELKDTQVDNNSLVEVDTQQDCTSFSFRTSAIKGGGELVEYVYLRKLVTCDPRDYRIEDGTTHVVWAKGRGPLYRLDNLNVTQEINTEQGMARVRFLKPLSHPDQRGAVPFLVNKDDVALSDDDTTYWCSTHKLPPVFKDKHHAIQYSAAITAGNEDIVHHMELFHCEGDHDIEFPLWAGPCGSDEAPPLLARCKKVIAAWAIGAIPFSYPEQAGLHIGGPGFNKFVMLEVHYNNQAKKSGIMDSSGLRFLVTPHLREFDASIMELGLEYNNRMAIPPKMDSFGLSGICSSECTAVGLPPEGIVIFGSQLHTHGAGKAVSTSRVRNGQELILNRDRHYSTHFQEIRELHQHIAVKPGDALVTTCKYNTENRENITLGGFGFSEEMCVNYVHYYPRTQLEVCKSSIDPDQLTDYFEKLAEEENQETSRNFNVEQNYRAIRWSPRRSWELDQTYRSRPISMQCQMADGALFPGYWRNNSQIEMPENIEEIDVCVGENKKLPDIVPAHQQKSEKSKRAGRPTNEMKKKRSGAKNEALNNQHHLVKKKPLMRDQNDQIKNMDSNKFETLTTKNTDKKIILTPRDFADISKRVQDFSSEWSDYAAWGWDGMDEKRSNIHFPEEEYDNGEGKEIEEASDYEDNDIDMFKRGLGSM